jgi:glycosyltransferase involved in cell wall biosynthesis
MDYPERLVRILVVADACRDRSAEVAEQAGATVLVRGDTEPQGRAHALAFAFESALRDGVADAFVVLDADANATPNLLKSFAARFEAGAGIVQAGLSGRDLEASGKTRAAALALAAFHTVRSLARERLRLSSRLRGSGMAFSRAALQAAPIASVIEDIEYGIRLGVEGKRVVYAHEAQVKGDLARGDGLGALVYSGQFGAVRRHAGKLLQSALQKKNPLLFDLVMEMAIPPLSVLSIVVLVGWSVSLAWARHHSAFAAYTWGLAFYFALFYVLRGWDASGLGVRGFTALMYAPAYVIERIGRVVRRR